jgi:hypothetical protein
MHTCLCNLKIQPIFIPWPLIGNLVDVVPRVAQLGKVKDVLLYQSALVLKTMMAQEYMSVPCFMDHPVYTVPAAL